MSRLDTLPPDQRAVLSLLLGQGKSFQDIAGLLRIDAETVTARAHAAVEALGPRDGDLPAPQQRQDVADYLLGQQTASERAVTRAHLERSPAARGWARVVAGELRPMAAGDLPEIPAEGAEVDEAFDALEARTAARRSEQRHSKRGGALLLAGLGILIVAGVLALVSGGGTHHDKATSTPPPSGRSPRQSTTAGQPQVLAQVNLVAPRGGSKALGIANVLDQGGQRALAIQAQGLARSSSHAAYAVWLVNSATDSVRLGFAPQVGSNGRLSAVAALPPNASHFQALVVTRETTAQPKQPGQIVLGGKLSLPGA